jgi:hypothetical protein
MLFKIQYKKSTSVEVLFLLPQSSAENHLHLSEILSATYKNLHPSHNNGSLVTAAGIIGMA